MILLSEFASAQFSSPRHMWVFFQNKGTNTLSSIEPSALGISDRAIKRRAKTLPSNRIIDELDLPVSQTALACVEQTGAKILVISRWFNAVSVEATPQQLQVLSALPGVSKLEPVVQWKRSHPFPSRNGTFPSSLSKTSATQELDYGPSATQLTNIKVVDLHAIGVNGTGVLIGMLDDGFNNYRTHAALKNIKVVADSDFIHNINDVSRQPWEASDQGNHGAGTLSAAGGFDNGHMIGASYGASFLLAKTEMDSSGRGIDFHSEEDTYVAALEWAERLGADITSSSLGYKEFSTLPFYTTTDLNGRTTKVAQATVIAARKGVLVVTAMGNDGYATGPKDAVMYADSTLVSPADADSIIAVGNTTSDGELNPGSGTGPTADGRIKPEVVAQGTGIFWADGSTISGYSQVTGTSCSTPLVAGAAALVLSAHPELSNMQIRHALLTTATPSRFTTPQNNVYPNNYYGYGFVDAYSAAVELGPVFSNKPQIVKTNNGFLITVMLVSKYLLYSDSIFYYYRYDETSSYVRTVT